MQNTVEILLSINQSVKEIAKSMTPKNGDSAEATAKLSRGDVANTADIKPAEGNGLKVDVSGASLGEIVKFLNMLSPSVTAIAKLSGSKMKNFTKVVDTIVASVKKMSDYAKSNEDAIKNVISVADSMNKFAEAIKKSSSLPVFAPLALLGFTMAKGAINVYLKILDKVGEMGNVQEKVKKLNDVTKSVNTLVNFVLKGALLFAVCIGLGALVMMGPTKQLILAGLAVLGTVLATTTVLVLLTGLAAKMVKSIGAIDALKTIMNTVLMATLLVTICLGLGFVVANTATAGIILAGLGVLAATLITLTAIILLTGLAAKMVKQSGAISSVRQIILMTLAIMGLVAMVYALGVVIDKLGGFKPIVYGIVVMAGVMLLLAGMFWLTGRVAKQAITKDTIIGLAAIIILTFATMGVVVAARKLGDMVIENEAEVITGIAATEGILISLVGIGFLAKKLLSGAKEGLIALGVLELLAVGAIGVTMILVQLEVMKKKHGITWLDLTLDLIGVVSIVGVFGVLAAALSFVSVYIMAGVAAFALIELLAAGAIGVAFLLLKLRQVRTDVGITWLDLTLDLIGVVSIVGVFGVLAAALSFVSVYIMAGVAAFALIELLAAGAIGVAFLLLKLRQVRTDVGITWLDLELEILGVAALIGTFGLMAAAFSIVAAPAILGAAALIPVEIVAAGAIGITHLLINLHNVAKESGVSFKELEKDVFWMSLVIGTFGIMAGAFGTIFPFVVLGAAALVPVEIMAAGAIGVTHLLINLHNKAVEAGVSFKELEKDVFWMSLVLGTFGLLAGAFGTIFPLVLFGSAALGLVQVMALGTIGITALLINLHEKAEEAGVTFKQLEKDVFWMSLVLGTFGLLAGAFGTIFPLVAFGTAAIGLVQVMTLGTIGITSLLIDLHSKAEENNVSFKQLEKDVIWMSAVLGTFGALASAMALLVIPITLGMPGMAMVSTMALGVIGVIAGLVDVTKAIEEAGGADVLKRTLSKDIPAILKNINKKNFELDMNLLAMGRLSLQYAKMGELITGVMTVVDAISKISQACGVITSDGMIKPVLSINEKTGEVTYGDPVDIKNIATVVSATVHEFVENLKFGMEHVQSMYNAEEIFGILATLVEPITKFVEMLVQYDTGPDGTLCTVSIDENGNIKRGAEVNVKGVAVLVAQTISDFVSELYKKENTENWAELIYGDRTFFQGLFGKTNDRAKSVSEIAGVLGVIIDPICSFIDMLVGLNPSADGKLSRIVYDSDGNVKEGKAVDVRKSAIIISGLISAFVGAIYGEGGLGSKKANYDPEAIEKLMKPMSVIIKTAEQMSKDDISAETVTKNSAAIAMAMTSIIMSVAVTVDTKALDKMLASIETMNNVVGLGLSDTNMLSDKITANSSAISSAVKTLIESVGSANVDLMNGCIQPLDSMVKIGAAMGDSIDGNKIIINSRSIATFMTDVVEKKFPKGTENVDKFTKSVKNLKTAFSELDTVLIKEEEKRQKALDKFGESIKSLMETLDGSKSSIDSFKELIDTIQSIDLNKLDRITNFSGSGTSYQPAGGGGGETNVNVDQTVNQVSAGPALGKEDIQSAIEEAFRNIQIVQQGVPSFDVNGDGNIDEGDLMTFAFQ